MDCLTIVVILVAVYFLLIKKEGTIAMPPGVLRIPGTLRSRGSGNPVKDSERAELAADDRVKAMLQNSKSGQWWNW